MSEQDASQSVETQDEQREVDVNHILTNYFGVSQSELPVTETDTSKQEGNEGLEELEEGREQSPPATEVPGTGRTVKFNKGDVTVSEDKIDETLQMGLALPKERERRTEYEKALQRAAKLAGYDSHEDYIKSLDRIEQESMQREQDAFNELKKQLLEDASYAGLDPDKVDQYLNNHPLMQQAKKAITELEKVQQQGKAAEERGALEKQWEELFSKHPSLTSSDNNDWITAEMDSLLKQGYHPLHAYELTNRDKIIADERKKIEQDVIKQQRLNKRSQVIGDAAVEAEDDAPEAVKGAFAMFGMDPKLAKKFITK